MNEEDDEEEGSRRILPTKRIKISILIFFPIYVLYYAWCNVWINDSILLICMIWVSIQWFYTTLHLYLSRMKPLC